MAPVASWPAPRWSTRPALVGYRPAGRDAHRQSGPGPGRASGPHRGTEVP